MKKNISNEYGRLAQGNNHNVYFQDVMEFIAKMNSHQTVM